MNTASQTHDPVDITRSKLPEITLAFWIMKICATTLGETAGDLLSMTLKIGYAASSVLLVGLFLVTLGAQLRSRAYHPLLYWTVILSTSTAGTTLSDFMDRTLGLGYATGSAILAGLLGAVLLYWKLSRKSLSIARVRAARASCCTGAPSSSPTRWARRWATSWPIRRGWALPVGRC